MRKKLLTCSLLISLLVLFGSHGAFALEKSDYYLGLGMGYHMDSFNADMDSDNTYGFNFSLGYDFSEKISVEFQYDKIREIGAKNSVSYKDADLSGYSLNFKYYPAIVKDRINGYVLIGAGRMKAESSLAVSEKPEGDQSDFCGKLGLGSDFIVTDKISFYLAAEYFQGFGDLDPLDFFSAKIGLKLYLF